MSGELDSSYPASGLVRNDIRADCGLDRLLSEPSPRQIARCGRANAARGGCARGSSGLGVESAKCSLDRLVVEPLRAQVVPDEGVASVSSREKLRAAEREALVVQEACTAERFQGFCALPRDEAQPAQALIQPTLRQGACLEGASRHAECAVPPQLTAEASQKRPFELETLEYPGANDDLLRKRPPALAVDLDRDAPGPGGA
jgi:hypothetical protein